MKDLISVIVPVYNVENYLKKCVNSIIEQTYDNLEIILVDDGTPDSSGKMCDEFSKEDSRIKIIHKKNGGLSSARNAGLDIATGDYVAFIDSDDYVSKEYFEILLKNIIATGAELSICKNQKFCDGDEIVTEKYENISEIYNQQQLIYELFKKPGVHECAWGKLYSKSIFEKIRFPIGRIYEDSSIMHEVYANTKKAVFTENELYYYLVSRNDSLMNTKYNLKKQNDNFLWLMERYHYLLDKFPDKRDLILAGHIRNSITMLERTYTSGNSEIIGNEIINKIEGSIRTALKLVDKNVLHSILDDYKLACLYTFVNNKDIYAKEIETMKSLRK